MTRNARGVVDVDPSDTCRSGKHFRTPKNTGTASTGRHFCNACKLDRERDRKARNPKLPKVKAKDVVLTPFEIERALASIPCMCCGAVPTRRGVGEDGGPRWLPTPVTDHAAGCTVGAQREIVQRNRSKSRKGVAA